MIQGNSLDVLEKGLVHLLKCDILPPKTYLAGGTAVYFYFKHRVSVDLDFFTPQSFNPDIIVGRMKNCFSNVVDVQLMEKDTVILYLSKEKIKFSLFSLPYKLLKQPQPIILQDDTSCPLASLEDIEVMKAVAITQWGSIKDFFDLYHLLGKTGHTFKDILSLVVEKYDLTQGYDYQLKTTFAYFDDAEKEYKDIVLIKKSSQYKRLAKKEWETIKQFFREFIK